jgi:predicted transcriptional regulator
MAYNVMQQDPNIQIQLKEDEIEAIISILHYASTACQISSMGEIPNVDHGTIQRILEKMEESMAIKSRSQEICP